MAGNATPVTISLPGLNLGRDQKANTPAGGDAQHRKATAYKIPPIVWMFAFFFIGYVGLRWMEK